MLLKDGDKTMEIPDEALRRRWGLPANATEAEIKAAIINRPPLPVSAARARAATPRIPGRPLLDAAARVQAASNEELRRLAGSPLTGSEREAVAEEIGHREFMARSFPSHGASGLAIRRYE